MIIKGRYKDDSKCDLDGIIFDHWQIWDGITTYWLDEPQHKPKSPEEYKKVKLAFETYGENVVLSIYEFDELYIMNNDGKTIETLRSISRERRFGKAEDNSETRSFESLCEPIVDYLRKSKNPHTKVMVTDAQAILLQDEMGVPYPIQD